MGGRDGIVTSRSMSRTERWGWRLLLPLLLTPAALSWVPIAAAEGEYGFAGRVALAVYVVAVLLGAVLLWQAGRQRPGVDARRHRSGPRHRRR